MWKLRRAAEAAELAVEGLRELLASVHHRFQSNRAIAAGAAAENLPECPDHLLFVFRDPIGLLAVGGRDTGQDIVEARQTLTRSIGKIGASIKRDVIVRGQKHGQRPTTLVVGQQVVRRLIDLVEVGPFLTIDFEC